MRRATILSRSSVPVSVPASRRTRLTRFWPVLLPLPAMLMAAWVMIDWKFNGLYGQDPFAYYDFGVGPLRRFLLDGVTLPAMFWPLGYPFLITLASLLLGPVTAAGQVVNLAASAGAVALTYLLGRDLLLSAGAERRVARWAGAVGALLLGMSGRLLESSVLIMADSVALVTALLSAWALVRWSRCREAGRSGALWLALMSAALAWSVVTRWGQGVLLPAWLAAALPALRMNRDHLRRSLAWAVLPAAAVLGAQVWLMLTVRPDPTLSPVPFAGDLGLVNGGSGWSILHLFQHDFMTPDGVLRYPWPNALFYASGPFLPQYVTPLFLPLVVLGLAAAAAAYRRALLLLATWPAFLLVFDAGLAEQNPRFILVALPPITILAGLGTAVLCERLLPRGRLVAGALLAAGLLLVATTGLNEVGALNRARNADLRVAGWTAARVPARAAVLSFGITLTLQHATALRVLDLSVLSKADLARLAATEHPLYLLVQEGAMNGQFAARPPGINYRSLRKTPGLIRLGTLHGYTLSRLAGT